MGFHSGKWRQQVEKDSGMRMLFLCSRLSTEYANGRKSSHPFHGTRKVVEGYGKWVAAIGFSLAIFFTAEV